MKDLEGKVEGIRLALKTTIDYHTQIGLIGLYIKYASKKAKEDRIRENDILPYPKG